MANAIQHYGIGQDFQLSTNSQLSSFDSNAYSWTGRTLTSWIDDESVYHLPAEIVNFNRNKVSLSAKWMLDKDWKVELCAINSGTEGSLSAKITEKNSLLPLADSSHQFISSVVLTSTGIYDGVHYNTTYNELSIEFIKEQKTNIKSIKYKPFNRNTVYTHYDYAENGDIDAANKRLLTDGSTTPSNVNGTSTEKCFSVYVDYTGDGIIEYYSNDNVRHSQITNDVTILKFETTNDYRRCGIEYATAANDLKPIIVDWNDGTIQEFSDEIWDEVHEYMTNGVFNVRISNISDIDINGNNDMFISATTDDLYTLKAINLGTTITKIWPYAYQNCYNLTSISIPNSVSGIIENYAFNNCNRLLDIIIPDSISAIGDETFRNCSCLMNLTIGSNVLSIGRFAFYNCISLSSINSKPIVAPYCGYYDTFGDYVDCYVGRNTYDTGKNILIVPENAIGYDKGIWLNPLQNPEKCGFNLSVMSI